MQYPKAKCPDSLANVKHPRHLWEPDGEVKHECYGKGGPPGRPKGDHPALLDFITLLKRFDNGAVQTRQGMAHLMQMSLAAFDQSLYRCRKLGMLPPAKPGQYLDPFGTHGQGLQVRIYPSQSRRYKRRYEKEKTNRIAPVQSADHPWNKGSKRVSGTS